MKFERLPIREMESKNSRLPTTKIILVNHPTYAHRTSVGRMLIGQASEEFSERAMFCAPIKIDAIISLVIVWRSSVSVPFHDTMY